MGVAQLQGFEAKSGLWNDSSAKGDTGWQDGGSIAVPFTIEVAGIVGADRVQVRGSNNFAKPDVLDIGRQIGSDISADGFVTVAAPVRWLRVIRSVKTGNGLVTVRIFGHRPAAG